MFLDFSIDTFQNIYEGKDDSLSCSVMHKNYENIEKVPEYEVKESSTGDKNQILNSNNK